MLYREKARKAFARGARWALDRYDSPPGIGDTMFNDSGALANDVEVAATGDSYQISVPGRLQAEGGGDLTEQLAELVPALDDPFSDAGVADAVRGVRERDGDGRLDDERETSRSSPSPSPSLRRANRSLRS